MVHRSVTDSKPFSPSGHGHRFSAICNHPVFGHVVRLLLRCCPPAILRAVVSVHINSINGQIILIARRHGPLSEYCVIVPLGADGDAAAAVVFIPMCIFVSTALTHSYPNVIEPFFSGMPVSYFGATARSGMSGTKIRRSNNGLPPAIAFANPCRCRPSRRVDNVFTAL